MKQFPVLTTTSMMKLRLSENLISIATVSTMMFQLSHSRAMLKLKGMIL